MLVCEHMKGCTWDKTPSFLWSCLRVNLAAALKFGKIDQFVLMRDAWLEYYPKAISAEQDKARLLTLCKKYNFNDVEILRVLNHDVSDVNIS